MWLRRIEVALLPELLDCALQCGSAGATVFRTAVRVLKGESASEIRFQPVKGGCGLEPLLPFLFQQRDHALGCNPLVVPNNCHGTSMRLEGNQRKLRQ